MLTQDHLTLRSIRLKSTEEWVHRREGLAFVLPKLGAGKCSAGKLAERIGPGDVLVLNEGEGGKLCPASGKDLGFWYFSIRLEHLFSLFAPNEITLLKSVADDLAGLTLYPASSAVAIECHRLVEGIPPQFNLDHRGQLVHLAATLLSEEFKVAHRQRGGFVRIEQHLLQVFENLSSDIILNGSIKELADRFGCGQRHLNRLFHQYFGFSAAALKMEMRMFKAAALLQDPDAKVITVAEECGFNHLGLFNICFKRRFGISPGRWRKAPLGSGSGPDALVEGDADCRLRETGLCPWFNQHASRAAASKPPPVCKGVRSAATIRSNGNGNGSAAKRPEVIPPTAGITQPVIPVQLQP